MITRIGPPVVLNPTALAVDIDDNLFIAETGNNRILKWDPETNVTTIFAGGGAVLGDGGAASQAKLVAPSGVAVDSQGNVYIADSGQFRIRRVDVATGVISTIVGTGVAGFLGDGGQATAARIGSVNGLAVDPAGNLVFSDVYNAANHRVRRVAYPAGTISTIVGSGAAGSSGDGGAASVATVNNPDGVVVDSGGRVIFCDRSNHRLRTVK